MTKYKPRKIQFNELIEVNDWKIKVYTISQSGEFNNDVFYREVIDNLPDWLNMNNSFDSTNDKIAFLILHSAVEGIFSIINWWVGKNMLNTNIFITNSEQLNGFTKISGDGLAPCIWELEIINHERISWTNNILKHESNPNYEYYLQDVLNGEF